MPAQLLDITIDNSDVVLAMDNGINNESGEYGFVYCWKIGSLVMISVKSCLSTLAAWGSYTISSDVPTAALTTCAAITYQKGSIDVSNLELEITEDTSTLMLKNKGPLDGGDDGWSFCQIVYITED